MPTLLRVHQYFDMGVEVVTYTSQAVCRHKNAILGPTPGNEHRSSTVFGTSESNQSLNINALCLMYLPRRDELNNTMNNDRGTGTHPAFRLQNPTLQMACAISSSFASKTASSVRCPPKSARRFWIAAEVISSLVWELSMRETNVVNR